MILISRDRLREREIVRKRKEKGARTKLSCETKDAATVWMELPERVSIENSNGN